MNSDLLTIPHWFYGQVIICNQISTNLSGYLRHVDAAGAVLGLTKK